MQNQQNVDESFADIFDAVGDGTPDAVRYFVEQQGVDVHVKDKHGQPLMYYSFHNPSVEVLAYLVSQGVDVNARPGDQVSPLHEAAAHGSRIESIAWLLDNGADIEGTGAVGWTPLFSAVSHGQTEAVKLLIERGANVNAIVRHDGHTPLHTAAREEFSLDIMRLLFEAGAKCDARDGKDRTPLHYAVNEDGTLKMVKLLVSRGADVNATDEDGETPLHKVAKRDSYDKDKTAVPILRYLISQGADVNAKNKDGKTPFDVADTDKRKCILQKAMEKK
ncbi:MAG: ankyrin repeat domain-containing protein [Planctomycetaceae bacterium]|jgi:ankyrin repeat protein|nr:ankyrin repeat domain-containing protein [Planctomycetaceae bacterium]